MKEFIKSLLSRKLLLTIAGAAALWSIKAYDQMTILILGYVGVQGGTDLVVKYKSRSLTATDVQNAVSQNEDYEVTDQVVPGTPLFDEKKEG